MKAFCPYIAGLCDEGYPGDLPCVMWDEEGQVCLVRENARIATKMLKGQPLLQGKIPIQDKESLNSLLRDLGEPEQ